MGKKRGFYIIANWMQGTALSGGDRIFIELVKRWLSVFDIQLLISKEGWEICKRENLEDVGHRIWASDEFNRYGYFVNYLYRSFIGIINVLIFENSKYDIIYSTSDFWPDSIPAFILKIRKPESRWIAGFYLFAPKPWQKESPYKGIRCLIGLFYWLTQLPVYWIVKRYADLVFVTSEPDVEKFITRKKGRGNIIVIRGGIDIKPSEEYLSSGRVISVDKRNYDACFVGRFHPQKGVLELIDIWKIVCDKKPEAKLAIIGVGPLERDVKEKIGRFRLETNIDLMGFKDGVEKYEIFKQSKIVVHPATYDSGGMAACEAMAWGLPGVSFDLESLKTYYPKGMLKTPCYDIEEFAKNILNLLDGGELYNNLSKDAVSWANEWDWGVRSIEILEKVKAICQ